MVRQLDFSGQVAVVTGAGRGIGRAYALLLASRGARVVVNDLGVEVDGTGASGGVAAGVVDEIRRHGGEAIANGDSVASEQGAANLIESALSAFGKVDVLVHNAGRNLGTVDEMLDVHVRAGVWLSDLVWPGMVDRQFGRIVLTTSASGLYGDGTGPGPNPKLPYATAKAGVVGLTKALAVRGAPAGIGVNAVSPTADTRLVGLNRGIESTRAGAPSSSATPDWVAENAPARLVAAGALWLMHEHCTVSGRLFAVGAGRVAEIFVGVTRGHIAVDGELTPEDVLAHFEAVESQSDYRAPVDMADYAQWLRSLVPAKATQTVS
ncbi:SDR family NAD(P)-dependent oxidoreductase [Streptomyces sp. NPDC001978]|uniref:SDR family NAD(P)-dependent oxidoreductase n=1 Tax=Streptomyces sp. NPDC001978 TaxID=3364627 RepID=UPI0036CC8A74